MMATLLEKGREGESMACGYLRKQGFDVQLCNWRSGHHEIDIIATRDGIVHFVEVKTRHSLKFGYPEEGVTRRKFNNLKNAACSFLTKYPQWLKIQFDILAILRLPGEPVEYMLLEDVYL